MLSVGNERTFKRDVLEDDKLCLLKIIRHFHSYPKEKRLSTNDLIPYGRGYFLTCQVGNRLPLYIIRDGNNFRTYEKRDDVFGYNLNHFAVVGEFKGYVRIAYLGSKYGTHHEQFKDDMKGE